MGEGFVCIIVLLMFAPVVVLVWLIARTLGVEKQLKDNSTIISQLQRQLSYITRELADKREGVDDCPTAKIAEAEAVAVAAAVEKSQELAGQQAAADGHEAETVLDAKMAKAVVDVGNVDVKTAKLSKSSMEEFIGKRALTWTGVAILFFAAIFFMRHAFENRVFGPAMQVTLSALVGLVLVGTGYFMVRRAMRPLGQGLTGLGQAVLYAAFAVGASSFYDPPVLGRFAAMALLGATTALGFYLAISLNALSTAIIALLGGMITPLMVATNINPRDTLFVYLLILNAGVLLIAMFKRWRSLDVIAMTGFYLLFEWWRHQYYHQQQMAAALCWVSVFYVFFLALPFICHLRRRENITVERFAMALANAIWFFLVASYLLANTVADSYALIAVILSVIYLCCSQIIRIFIPRDTISFQAMLVMSVSFASAAVLLYFDTEARVLVFALEAIVLFQLSCSFRQYLLRVLAWAVLGLACFYTVMELLPPHSVHYAGFFSSEYFSCLIAPSAMCIFSAIAFVYRSLDTPIQRRIRIDLANVGALMVLVMTFWNASMFIYESALRNVDIFDDAIFYTWYWAFASLGFLIAGLALRCEGSLKMGSITLIPPVVAAMSALAERYCHNGLLFLNLPFMMSLGVVVVLMFYSIATWRAACWLSPKFGKEPGAVFAGMCMVMLLMYLSMEIYMWTEHRYGDRCAGLVLTSVWSLYAMIVLLAGMFRSRAMMRYAALVLLAACAVKLFVFDTANTSDLLRFVLFLATGALFIAGAFAYNRYGSRIIEKTNKTGQ